MSNVVAPAGQELALRELGRGGAEEQTRQSQWTFDDVLAAVRPLGPWQLYIYLWLAPLQFFTTIITIAVVFYQITPPHNCRPVGGFPLNNSWTVQQKLNISSPKVPSAEGSFVADACRLFDFNYTTLSNDFDSAYSEVHRENRTPYVVACDSWSYNRSIDMKETAVTQFDLICDDRFGIEYSQTVYMFGFLVGAIIGGALSDRYGRKLPATLFAIMGSVVGILLPFSPNFWFFLVGRFLISVMQNASSVAFYVMGLETTSSRWRVWVGGLYFMPWALGYTAAALFTYLLPDWRYMHVIVSSCGLVAVFYFWFLPESPRWLLAKGRVDEARRLLETAAKMNGGTLPADAPLEQLGCSLQRSDAGSSETLLHVFRFKDRRLAYPIMALRCLNLCFNWFVNAMVYYGLSLNVSSLAGDRFINNAISGAVEIPAYMLCVPCLFWGRRKSLFATLLLAGLALLLIPWIPKDLGEWPALAVAMVGKMAITMSFALVYVITTEIYPTMVRNSGLAVSSCVARIGSAIAPYISSIEKFDDSLRWTTMLIFAVFSLAAAMLTLFLPETKGKKLPERLEDSTSLQKEKPRQNDKAVPSDLEREQQYRF